MEGSDTYTGINDVEVQMRHILWRIKWKLPTHTYKRIKMRRVRRKLLTQT